VRYATTQEPLSSQLDGVVEIDEAYVCGRCRVENMPSRLSPKKKGRAVRRRASALPTNAVEGSLATLRRGIGRPQGRCIERSSISAIMPVGVSDVERRDFAIRQVGGKRLKYRD
jgi:hypothetical protein